jgi:hypothetical protein
MVEQENSRGLAVVHSTRRVRSFAVRFSLCTIPGGKTALEMKNGIECDANPLRIRAYLVFHSMKR